MKQVNLTELRKINPVFEQQVYRSTDDKKQYILNLLLMAAHKKKATNGMLCMNELIEIITQLDIPLRTSQMTELYFYSTYQQFEQLRDTKKKIIAVMNQQKKKVDFNAVVEWISNQIAQFKIKFKNRSMTVFDNSTQPKMVKTDRLPSLIGSSSDKLQDELKYLIQIFEEMEKTRQNSGLIPINDENDENEVQVPSMNIPYDPELYDLNNSLCKLRIKAEDRLSRIIQLARDDNRIRVKLEEAIERFQKARIEANQKVGRMGAIKAQERLKAKKLTQLRKMQELNLGQGEDLVHATHLYALLSLPEIKSNRLII